MGFLTLRELRGSTQQLDQLIQRDGSVIVTNNGKPTYLMLGINEADLEQTLIDLRRLRAKRAVDRMQRTAARLGNDTLTLEEIGTEIAADRSARR
ncbi:MAG: hypothetical protein FWF43_02365 [Propionibacteriaceae bacterium]|nr:hypothetical protein [Propionibacteriaceae bacterium]